MMELALTQLEQSVNIGQWRVNSDKMRTIIIAATCFVKACVQTAQQWKSLKLAVKKSIDEQIARDKKAETKNQAKSEAAAVKLAKLSETAASSGNVSKNDFMVLHAMQRLPIANMVTVFNADDPWPGP